MSGMLFDVLRNNPKYIEEASNIFSQLEQEEELDDKEIDEFEADDEDEETEFGDYTLDGDLGDIDDADIEDATNEFSVDPGMLDGLRPDKNQTQDIDQLIASTGRKLKTESLEALMEDFDEILGEDVVGAGNGKGNEVSVNGIEDYAFDPQKEKELGDLGALEEACKAKRKACCNEEEDIEILGVEEDDDDEYDEYDDEDEIFSEGEDIESLFEFMDPRN